MWTPHIFLKLFVIICYFGCPKQTIFFFESLTGINLRYQNSVKFIQFRTGSFLSKWYLNSEYNAAILKFFILIGSPQIFIIR